MKIEAIAHLLPSRMVDNGQLIEIIRAKSAGKFQGDLEATLKLTRRLLSQSGSNTRFWLAEDEEPNGLILQVCEGVMSEVGGADKVDLLIYASIYSDLAEPSCASMLAWLLGMRHVECLDIKAGCDGWMKAVQIAGALFDNQTCQRVMIVNAEFCVTQTPYIQPLFELDTGCQLEWRFPAFTIGEGVCATILNSSDAKWKQNFFSRNDLFDLCTVTLPWYKKCLPSERIAPDGSGLFTGFGADLFREGWMETVKVFRGIKVSPADIDICFTHSSSYRDWQRITEEAGLAGKVYDIAKKCGNVVSASIPIAISMAKEEGKLQRGDRVIALSASAGMSFSCYYFTY